MTRYTSLGRKRTHVEAGFDNDEPSTSQLPKQQVAPSNPTPAAGASSSTPTNAGTSASQPPAPADPSAPQPRKHRKRHRSKKGKGLPPPVKKVRTVPLTSNVEGEGAAGMDGDGCEAGERSSSGEPRRKKIRGLRQPKDGQPRTTPPGPRQKGTPASEARRLKRIEERNVDTTCFACREKGHAARDCPRASEIAGSGSGRGNVVGICYRCGSQKHTLSKCRKPADPGNPLPFASCFVCSGQGHLAGSCPQNQNKGVYPNGGSCKICGDTTHLAKECAVRRDEVAAKSSVGTGFGAGADEDDFMVMKRRATEVEKQEHVEERRRHVLEASDNAPAKFTPQVAAKKKVVVF